MAKFNLGHKLIELFNSTFSTKIATSENGEDRDDVTLLDETKTALSAYVDGIQAQLTDLTAKAEGQAAMQTQIDTLTSEVAGYKTQIAELQKANTDLQSNFNKQLIDLKADVRKELAKEKISTGDSTLETITETNPKGKKEIAVEWKENNAPTAMVGK